MYHETQKNEKIEKIVSNSTLKMTEFAKLKFALIIHKIDQKIKHIQHKIENRTYQFHKMSLLI